MPAKWWRFWRRPAAQRGRSDLRVVVYTRAQCPLCDQAAAFLERERDKLGFSLEFVDIAPNAELTALHGDWVPVVEVDGKVRFRGAINPVLWARLLGGS